MGITKLPRISSFFLYGKFPFGILLYIQKLFALSSSFPFSLSDHSIFNRNFYTLPIIHHKTIQEQQNCTSFISIFIITTEWMIWMKIESEEMTPKSRVHRGSTVWRNSIIWRCWTSSYQINHLQFNKVLGAQLLFMRCLARHNTTKEGSSWS